MKWVTTSGQHILLVEYQCLNLHSAIKYFCVNIILYVNYISLKVRYNVLTIRKITISKKRIFKKLKMA